MRQIEIYDTTLRDGTQREGISFSVEDKIRIVRKLDELGFHFVEGGWPGSNPKDIEFFERMQKIPLKRTVLTAFGSTRRAGITAKEDQNVQAIIRSGVKVATIFGKAWDFHVTDALRTTLEENLNMIYDTVSYLVSQGLQVNFDAEHFFDGYKRNPDYALATLRAAARAGARCLVLCDTNGGTLPHEVQRITKNVIDQFDLPIGIHAHNDSGVAVANSLLAVEAGASQVQGTINGYGERAGNADLCVIIPSLQLKMGFQVLTDEDLGQLTQMSHYVSEQANIVPDDHQPYVGRSAFAHKGGIHVSALLRHPQTYEHILPELVGNRRRVLISELAGASNIIYKARECGIELDKDSDKMREILSTIKQLEHDGYYFEGAEASFEMLLNRVLGLYEPFFELVGFRLITDRANGDLEARSEATIKIKVHDRIYHTAAEGNGPVNALDGALRKALIEVYPQVEQIKLSDYKVRVLDEQSGTAAKVRVLIQSTDDGMSWGTVGVSPNIIEASWIALVDSIEYGLLKAKAGQ